MCLSTRHKLKDLLSKHPSLTLGAQRLALSNRVLIALILMAGVRLRYLSLWRTTFWDGHLFENGPKGARQSGSSLHTARNTHVRHGLTLLWFQKFWKLQSLQSYRSRPKISTLRLKRFFFLRPLQDGGYLPWEPKNYSRSRYIIIQRVLSPKI